MTRRIGLYGGSFDPVHVAHLALGRLAAERLQLDQLRWIPAGRAWQKAGAAAPAADRIAMLRLALAAEPHAVVDPCETERTGPSYTIDTILAAQAAEPGAEWFLVIGQDQYARFDTWHRWRDCLARVTLAVAGRAGEEPRAPAALQALPHRCVTLPLPPMDVSATEIRRRVAVGAPIAELVPAEVARYIDQHGLYRAGTRS